MRVLIQEWEESDEGWTRPDGRSVHLSEADGKAFIAAYWREQLLRHPTVPSEYSRPCGDPYFAEVDEETFERASHKHGAWLHGKEPNPSCRSGCPRCVGGVRSYVRRDEPGTGAMTLCPRHIGLVKGALLELSPEEATAWEVMER